MEPGSTVEVDRAADGEDPEVKIEIVGPKPRKRQTVGVGAKGAGEGGDGESGDGSPDLPENPEVLPEVPDAPPADEATPDDS
jgi:hypothetical protein